MKAAAVMALISLIVIASSSCRHTPTPSMTLAHADDAIHVSPEVHDTKKLSWTALSNYVAMNVPFEPIAAVKKEVEAREGLSLQSRGEAHITLISPPEMSVLRSRLNLAQINGLIEKMDVQSIPFQIKCVGRAQLKAGTSRLASYFLVLNAPDLIQLRERLRQQFVLAGGDKQAFLANAFEPHITVGFTERDLFETDGVIKDSRSCLYKVE